MRDKDKSIGNPPTKSNPEGNGVAGEGFVDWVVDEDGKGVVGEGDLDGSDGGRDVFGGDEGDFERHFVAGVGGKDLRRGGMWI